ncbi:MAG: alpha/beta hydrolase [Myxococcales bacterium]|nr:alpha/beta hydrolase [Myxococcales bacterium]
MRQLTLTLAAAQAGAAQVVPISAGFTFLEVRGDGPPLVLVHGMTSPSLVWERVVPLLVGGGHRVVRYDLYGRGLSERPDVPMTAALYHAQLDGVIASACAEPPVLVGYSWGAGIVASWAANAVERVRRVVLVAPGGVGVPEPWGHAALRVPGLGEALVALGGRRGLLADVGRMFTSPDTTAAYLPRFVEQLQWQGYDRCFLSTLRHCPPDWEQAYAALGRTSVPVDVLWGDADRKVPIAAAGRLSELIPQARLHVVSGGAHGMPWESAEGFGRALAGVLSRVSSG